MGYIGSDPRNKDSVSTSQLVDDAVTNAKLVDDVLFSSVTSSIVSASGNITADTFTGTFNGALSSSAQIATSISGSSTSLSSSLSTRATTLESASGSFASDLVTLKGSGTTQGVGQSNSPIFTAITVNTATVTGTLTAQEVHTEFESASILFTSGSTQFGNSSDDVHEFKGNLISGSSTSTASLAMISLADKIEHIGDTNNTIEFGTDEIKLRTGGGSRLIARDSNVELYNDLVVAGAATFNEDSGDKDFRVESNGNTHMFFVDGGANSVGIGTTAPSGALHVNGANPTVFITNSTQDGASTLLRLTEKKEVDGNAGAYLLYNGSSNIFQIGTNISGTDTPSMTLLRDGSGKVGIGSSNPTGIIDVMGTSGYAYFTTTSPAAFNMIFRSGSADPQNNWLGQIEFTGASGGTSQIVTRNSTALALGTNNSQKVTIGTDGNTAFAGQVKLKDGASNNLSLAFANDTDTGLYLGGTNALGFVTNGAVALELQGTQLADFRGDLQIPEYIKHSGDTDTSIRFTDNKINFIAGNDTTMELIDGGGVITHGALKASLTAAKSVGSGANVITFTVTVSNVSSWEPINWLVEANYTTANLSAQGYYFGWGHTYHYSASGLAATSIGHGGASSNITVTCGNHSSNSFDITVTSATTSGTINMVASLDIRARHGISNIVAA